MTLCPQPGWGGKTSASPAAQTQCSHNTSGLTVSCCRMTATQSGKQKLSYWFHISIWLTFSAKSSEIWIHTQDWWGCPCLKVVPQPRSENSQVWLRTTSVLPHFSPSAHCEALPYSPGTTCSQIAGFCPVIGELSWCKLSLFNRNIPTSSSQGRVPCLPERSAWLREYLTLHPFHPTEPDRFFLKGGQSAELGKDV